MLALTVGECYFIVLWAVSNVKLYYYGVTLYTIGRGIYGRKTRLL